MPAGATEAERKRWEDTLTPAERKFLEIQRKREKDVISRAVSEPHKKKVEKLNQYLDSLPVHFDIPKVRSQCLFMCRLELRYALGLALSTYTACATQRTR